MHSIGNDATQHHDHSGSSRVSQFRLLTPGTAVQAEFCELFREMALELHQYASQRVGATQAEDLVSDTFLTVWRRWRDLPEVHEERRAWVYGVLKRNILEHRTLEARRSERIAAAVREQDTVEVETVEQQVVSEEWVRATLAELPENQATAIRLAVLDGFTAREIAINLGLTTTAVTTRISRGRAAIRLRLTTREGDR